MLEQSIIEQLKSIFSRLKSSLQLRIEGDTESPLGKDTLTFVTEVASASPLLEVMVEYSPGLPQFCIAREGHSVGITFRGIPNGHEFSTLLLAILNADGEGKNLPDEATARRIAALRGPVELQTYVSLTCTNCPDVAQALNVIALYNPQITNSVTDGAVVKSEVEGLGIQAVPAVYANGELLSVGRASLPELLDRLEEKFGVTEPLQAGQAEVREFDVVVLGAGPAGASAAIYTARKNKKVAVIGAEAGGNVNLTNSIENLITTRETTGRELAAELRQNMIAYGVELFEGRRIESVDLNKETKVVNVKGGEVFQSRQVIVATGTVPRKMGVPGEDEYVGRGIAFCPHCDGPAFRDKKVAVIGGGNAGIEAAIDLAAICSEVEVYEFLDELRADPVLIDKVQTLPNVKIFLSRQVVSVEGDGKKVTALVVKDRTDGRVNHVPLSGVFVQIGYMPNSSLFEGMLELNSQGEIKSDSTGHTSLENVYVAGDVSDFPYKQIVTSIGMGAAAALSAFDDAMRS